MNRRCLLALSLALSSMTLPADAQIRASEPATVSQTVDGTVVTIEYSRPRARGRDTLFGGEVYWGEVWTPGANWATTLETNRDIRINGHELAAGKYSVWMVVNENRPWTVVLDSRARRFHLDRPGDSEGVLRFDVDPTEAPWSDVLTWSFPGVSSSGMTASMHWGRTRVDMDIAVEPTYALTIPEADAAPYLGNWEMRWSGGGGNVPPISIALTWENGMMIGRMDPLFDPDLTDGVFIRIAPDWFISGWLQNGELYDVSSDMVLEFAVVDGRATSFEVRSTDDQVVATGTRRD